MLLKHSQAIHADMAGFTDQLTDMKSHMAEMAVRLEAIGQQLEDVKKHLEQQEHPDNQ